MSNEPYKLADDRKLQDVYKKMRGKENLFETENKTNSVNEISEQFLLAKIEELNLKLDAVTELLQAHTTNFEEAMDLIANVLANIQKQTKQR